ncbi:MAG: serine--tRNA ligase [Planctomycetota bacterium]|jgi:seryl-tRNA synthetase|nr:serine--tRNA ligase [Planctomycetota bacterium]
MLNIELIRNEPDRVKAGVKAKNVEIDIDAIAALDTRHRELRTERDKLRNEQTTKSKQIPQAKKNGEDIAPIIEEMNRLKTRVNELEDEARELNATIQNELLYIPNLPSDTTPIGHAEEDNVEIKKWGEQRSFEFQPKPHWDVCTDLGIVDFERATKISGSGFGLYMGDGARLERALINYMLDLHAQDHGYLEVFPPFVVNRDTMTGTGQLPKMEDDMYRLEADDLFLIPTAEVPVTNIHRDEILNAEDLPVLYQAYTPCFRREAGAAGRDTRGLIRVHQFDKVEMVKFVTPETSYDELETLLENAEDVLQSLGLNYRVLELCSGDISFAAAKCYDIELWAPGLEQWLEVSSCSNFEDFQARRMNIRYRSADRKGTQYIHTLNGSGVALARLFIAIVENYQQEDGSIALPEALQPYMGGQTEIRQRD